MTWADIPSKGPGGIFLFIDPSHKYGHAVIIGILNPLALLTSCNNFSLYCRPVADNIRDARVQARPARPPLPCTCLLR
jgi:hypothetical protein